MRSTDEIPIGEQVLMKQLSWIIVTWDPVSVRHMTNTPIFMYVIWLLLVVFNCSSLPLFPVDMYMQGHFGHWSFPTFSVGPFWCTEGQCVLDKRRDFGDMSTGEKQETMDFYNALYSVTTPSSTETSVPWIIQIVCDQWPGHQFEACFSAFV